MSKINLDLDFDEIRKRIELVKADVKPSTWAKYLVVSKNIVTNIHGETKQRPSLEYIVAVARFTGKPVEWYLYGDQNPTDKGTNLISEPHSALNADKKPHFCGPDWTDDDVRYCKQLKKILDSKNPVIVPAIISNLAAFEYSVTDEKRKSKEIDDLKSGMKQKSGEIKDLKKRLVHLEELTDPAGPSTGTVEAE